MCHPSSYELKGSKKVTGESGASRYGLKTSRPSSVVVMKRIWILLPA